MFRRDGKWQMILPRAGAPCSIISIDAPGGKMEAVIILTGAALTKAGALVGFHTDDGITDSRLFMRSAALMVRGGMSREKALEGLTIAGAEVPCGPFKQVRFFGKRKGCRLYYFIRGSFQHLYPC